MATFAELVKLAEQIKDKKLRKMTVDLLKNPGEARSPVFKKYKAADFKKIPAAISFHHLDEGGLLEHTLATTRMCIAIAEALEKTYKVNLDKDSLIAASLIHDVGKLYTMKKGKTGWENTECLLDHTMLGTSELYARGFPETVVHIVASHFGEEGPTPPQTIEALLFHKMDNLDAKLGTPQQPDQADLLKMLGIG
jgi:7,8-dihydroneopterin 2',3'-cyclic phosphate phosphodiesterase